MTPTENLFTPEMVQAANTEVARLSSELDLTNADHIALWLENNFDDNTTLEWLAVHIADAHRRALSQNTGG